MMNGGKSRMASNSELCLLAWAFLVTGAASHVCTTSPLTCVFPFTYKGEVYHSCTTAGVDFYWCSSVNDFADSLQEKRIRCYDCAEHCTKPYRCGCPMDDGPLLHPNPRNNASVIQLGATIPPGWVCDGVPDCDDQSDELYCSCDGDRLQCGCKFPAPKCYGGAGCYPRGAACDGVENCMLGTDELYCKEQWLPCPCNNTEGCVDSKLIPLSTFCDGVPDCVNGTDEADCPCPESSIQCAITGQTADRSCTKKSFFCDGQNNCNAWEDEAGCSCSPNQFQCDCFANATKTCPNYNGCLPQSERCDSFDQCGDGSDERDCVCASDKIDCPWQAGTVCAKGVHCIFANETCDGYLDCPGGLDEFNCTCPGDKFTCDCYGQPGSAWDNCRGCLDPALRCNGRNDCYDWSDEQNCTCGDDQFECACGRMGQDCGNGPKCIPGAWECDYDNDCADASDEMECACPFEQRRCPCPSHNPNCTLTCIDSFKMCDGLNDCPLATDEPPCCNVPDRIQCPGSERCISKYWLCDGENDCGRWEDEIGCKCTAGWLPCACYDQDPSSCPETAKIGCVLEPKFCDSINDCSDWSDESNCSLPVGTFACKCVGSPADTGCHRAWIDAQPVCDGLNDCGDWSDEIPCDCSQHQALCGCTGNENRTCEGQGRCIDLQKLSDGVKDCLDGSDEPCATSLVPCSSCVVRVSVCKGENATKAFMMQRKLTGVNATCVTVPHTSSNSSKTVCISGCDDEACKTPFQCLDGSFIPLRGFCDRKKHCPDGSDELQPTVSGFKCFGAHSPVACLLPQANLLDKVAQCKDKSDLCSANSCFRCFDNSTTVGRSQVCDGVVDCVDLSDECFCEDARSLAICEDVFANFTSECELDEMPCANDVSNCSKLVDVICNGVVQCEGGADERHCQAMEAVGEGRLVNCSTKYGSVQATECDKRPECDDMSDECSNCPEQPAFCTDPCRFHFRMGERYCDGEPDPAWHYIGAQCPQGFDERDCPTRVPCDPGKPPTIDIKQLCDGKVDCERGSDEAEDACPGRFYCWGGTPLSVDRSAVKDGRADCADGSDEAGVFSSVYEMISNEFLRALLWIMAFMATAGNLIVIFTVCRKLRNTNYSSPFTSLNLLLVLNLAAADLLLGVYLATVAAFSLRFSGSYWSSDREWRLSVTCSLLGFLVVLSSEASILFMSVTTTLRVITLRKPLRVSNIRQRTALLLLVSVWLVSLALAAVPLLDFGGGYFTSSVWMPNLFTRSEVLSKSELGELAARLSRRVNASLDVNSWSSVLLYLRHHGLAVRGQFGYYGENSVCMPRLFSSAHADQSWHFSTALLSLNLLLFVYIAVAYLYIYRKGRARVQSSENDRNAKLQSRIARLIFTDFCCWVPVCVLSYVHLGGVQMSGVAYAVSAIVLLPINSVLNPLLYSATVEQLCVKACGVLKNHSLPRLKNIDAVARGSSRAAVVNARRRSTIKTTADR